MGHPFTSINQGYDRTFKAEQLSLGLVVPLENYSTSAVPSMENQVELIQLADRLGFASVWLRDVPYNVPSFGDAGHIYDPFVYLGLLAAQTQNIALGVASIVLPLRHPAHVAKAAASVDVLSGGRLLLGVASGDRPEEYPALNIPFEQRGRLFRESYQYIQNSWQDFAAFENHYGSPRHGIDLIPKPERGRLPTLITGSSQQSDEWLATHGDGWMLYPRELSLQRKIIRAWRERTSLAARKAQPAIQPLYIDLLANANASPKPIHLGFQLGIKALKEHLIALEEVGVNHVALNLRFNQRPVEETLYLLAEELLPIFPSQHTNGGNQRLANQELANQELANQECA